MLNRLLSLCLFAAALSGCVTVPNPLAPHQIEALHLTTVTVEIDPAATLWWGDGDRAYARSKGQPEQNSEELSKTPEARAFIAKAASEKITAALQEQLKPVLAGKRPVKVVLTLRRLYLASIIQRITVGGAHEMIADIAVIDAKTGAPILSYPEFRAAAMAGQGIGGTLLDAALMSEPIDRLTANFAQRFRDWLLPQQQPQ
ncbi:MAG TPA: DUF6778 family protein [Bosea sp. (in: a-proteobacteria)]|jgi:hypothetical protein|uniref:DUF6778 family protein n=1 Tax=Bosea sp. (in: a-proteobacteria) TaxID=1871050 RepID=UPI002E120646|nr:DUF6778 family protein [Bosea sp. (in: a-proteobacteria)]